MGRVTLIKLSLSLSFFDRALMHMSLLFLAGSHGPELCALLAGIISGSYRVSDGRCGVESVSER